MINPILLRTNRISPKMIVSEHCLETVGPKRKHRKKRIQKKFIKLYGMNYKSTVTMTKLTM